MIRAGSDAAPPGRAPARVPAPTPLQAEQKTQPFLGQAWQWGRLTRSHVPPPSQGAPGVRLTSRRNGIFGKLILQTGSWEAGLDHNGPEIPSTGSAARIPSGIGASRESKGTPEEALCFVLKTGAQRGCVTVKVTQRATNYLLGFKLRYV